MDNATRQYSIWIIIIIVVVVVNINIKSKEQVQCFPMMKQVVVCIFTSSPLWYIYAF